MGGPGGRKRGVTYCCPAREMSTYVRILSGRGEKAYRQDQDHAGGKGRSELVWFEFEH